MIPFRSFLRRFVRYRYVKRESLGRNPFDIENRRLHKFSLLLGLPFHGFYDYLRPVKAENRGKQRDPDFKRTRGGGDTINCSR